ncbi:MAG: hypothetical protein A3E87_01575 [Gammaproteobacteria bacterium RIFCSPHIGHO2_12_FULL_35_23]|nr:MAG: hypothetical protein A3E87_01575 [Gammaproteobacteria bacterium RIFCSPHIGHO2_12_FULL_35_23]
MLNFIAPLLTLGNTLIERVFPDKADQEKAKLALLTLEQQGELKRLEAQMNMIVAEAQSSDKWTSRARPAFLYVIYIMILAAIPMGIIYAFNPTIAGNIEIGVTNWLKAIPEGLWALFGAGYLGYVGSRSYDKKNLLKADRS